MEFSKFVEWAFLSILSGGVVAGVTILYKVHNDLKSLGLCFERLLVSHEFHQKELARLDREIQRIWDLSDRN